MNLLRLFPQFRSLETSLETERNSRIQAEQRAVQYEARANSLSADLADWKQRLDRSEKRVEDLTEKIMNAGDAVALRVIGRRMFGKAPVEAPPQPSKDPVNISAGANKRLGRNAVRESTAKFFHELASQSGVDQKTN